MIEISEDLAAIQKRPDTRTEVSITAEPFGYVPDAPMLEWSVVAPTDDDDYLTLGDVSAAVGLADGSLLCFKWESGNGYIQIRTVAQPDNETEWITQTWANTSLSVGTVLRMAVARDGENILLAWSIASRIYASMSIDSGATWGTAQVIYSVTVEDRPLGVYRSGGYWLIGYTSSGPRPRLAWSTAGTGSWTLWSGPADYRFAGAAIVKGEIAVFVYRDNSVVGVDTAWVRRYRLSLAGVQSSYYDDMESMIGGLSGTNFYDLFYRNVYGGDAGLLGMAIEGGIGGGFTFTLSSVFDGDVWGDGDVGDLRIDEPVQSPMEQRDLYSDLPADRFELAAAGENVYALRARGEFSEVWVGTPVDVPADGYLPIKYNYDWHLGRAFIEFSARGSVPLTGSMLTIERTVRRGEVSGTQSVKMLVIMVERWRDRIRVRALDALGWLNTYRARRTVRIAVGTEDLWETIPRLFARCGLRCRYTDDVGDEISFTVTHPSGESARGNLYRLMSTGFGAVAVVPGEFALQISRLGDCASTPHEVGDGSGQTPAADVLSTIDGRRLASSFVLGQESTDPLDGSFLGGWLGPAVPGMRPAAVSFTNTRYNKPVIINSAAQAEADRQLAIYVDAEVIGGPDLSYELYDRVNVSWSWFGWESKEFRLHGIVERWDHKGMSQELHLGDRKHLAESERIHGCDYAFD